MYTRRRILLLLGTMPCWGLSACDPATEHTVDLQPVPIADGDECHMCGMIISRFPGPKGEAFVQGASIPLKFCSTRDLFAFLTQPEAQANVLAAFVHDIGKTSWEAPTVDAFIDARSAWYVADQPLRGAMGPTLASFAERAAAERFISEHGGRLLAYGEITPERISNLR